MPKKLSQFWQDLKRRNVVRVITVYAGAAFVILSLVDMIREPFELPNWSFKLVIIILSVGLIIAVILSWIYDIHPDEGMIKTEPADKIKPEELPSSSKGWKIATYVSLVVIVGLITYNIVLRTRNLQSDDIRTIMILPFKNYTGNEQLNDYISGLHYALIVDIGRLGGINVLSKTTSDVYVDVDKTISQIASEQGADVILEPAIMRLDDSIYFELTAIAPDEKTIWHRYYQEDISQIFNLHNRITMQIADEVRIRLSNVEERLLTEPRTTDPDALEAYIKGQLYLDELRVTSLQLATQYFETAIRYDPEWGPPYAGMAMVGAYQQQMGFETPSTTIPVIYQYLNKAFELDPNSARSHYAAAVIAAWTEWDWDKALQEFQKSLELNPNNALCRMFYAHMLLILHRYDEALAQGARAVELDPLRPFILALNSVLLRMTGSDEEAYTQVEKALSIEPDQHFANRQLDPVSYVAGDYDRSLRAFFRIASYLTDDVKTSVEQTFEEQGYYAALEEMIMEMEEMAREGDVRAMPLAQLYLRVNNIPKAIYWLEKGYELHDPGMPYLSVYRNEALRADPGYHELLRKMNLPLPED